MAEPRGFPRQRVDLTDLRQRLDARTLVTLALEAVQRVPASSLRSAAPMAHSLLQPRMMLTLLSYCYGAGILGSKHVEQVIQDDPMALYICAGTRPSEKDIREFRRRHRAQVKACLAQMIAQAWRQEMDTHAPLFARSACQAEDLQRYSEKSAAERLDVATFIDLMERED